MKKRLKTFGIYLGSQFINYTILVFNIRLIAKHNIPGALLTDALYATSLFFIIKRVSNDSTSIEAWAGFVIGSVLGTWLGMSI